MRQPAVVGHEVVGRVLGRHPALDGEAVRPDGGLVAQADLRVGQRQALGDQDLALDDVVAGHLSVTVCSTWMRGLTSMK